MIVRRRLRISGRSFDVKLPLRHRQCWSMLFARTDVGENALILDEFGRRCADASVVYDIGANAGMFSLYALAHMRDHGTVVAVEPNPELARLLRNHAARNPECSLEVVEAVVTSEPGHAVLFLGAVDLVSSLDQDHVNRFGPCRESIQVASITIDDLARRAGMPNLVKLDVEGAELAALGGASTTLDARQTTWIVEVTDTTVAAVHQLMSDAGYVLGPSVDRRVERSPTVPSLPAGVGNLVYVPA